MGDRGDAIVGSTSIDGESEKTFLRGVASALTGSFRLHAAKSCARRHSTAGKGAGGCSPLFREAVVLISVSFVHYTSWQCASCLLDVSVVQVSRVHSRGW